MGTKLARELSSTTGISIAALLDRASENKRVATDQTEEQKGKGRIVSHQWMLSLLHGLTLTRTAEV